MKRWAGWLAVVAAACTAMAVSGTAAADPPGIVVGADGETSAVFSYANAIRERVFVPVPGVDQDADGADDRVAVDIIRPLETNAGLKVPAIIDPSPYYTSLGRGNESEFIHTAPGGYLDKFPLFYDNFFVPRGYAFIAAQAVGTAFSTGCPLHGGPGDVAGFKAVIDWLRGRTPGYDKDGNPVTAGWNNGKNAMIGKSYDGTFANGVAATGVEGLTTIVPISAISDWYDYSRMGGIRFNTNYPASLSSTITQNRDAATLGVVPPDRNAPCATSRTTMSGIDGDEDGDINPFWQDRDYNVHVGNVHAAVFASHGLNDDNVRPNHFAKWWDGLGTNGVPRKLWLTQTGHVDPFDYRRSQWVDTLHRWFDHWLQGVDNGIMSDPQVDIETAPNTWETQPSWPLPDTKPIDVYLQGTTAGAQGTLGLSSDGGTDTLTFTDANLSENNYLSLTNTQANKLLFLSPVLAHDLRISGTPVVKLQASLGKEQSNLTAFVVDYGTGVVRVNRTVGDGVQTNTASSSCYGETLGIDDGCYFDVVERTTTPATSWRVSKGILDSSNRDSLFSGFGASVIPGQQYAFTWPTLPNDFTFPAGHRIGIVLGANFSQFGSVNGTTQTPVTVDTKASTVVLPIVGGYPAALAAGLVDSGKPTLTLPDPITVDAVSPAGRVVTFTATATDLIDPSPTVTCTPASGSTFAIGTTTVTCTAKDSSQNETTGTFTVHVRGAAEQLATLRGDVTGAGPGTSLRDKVKKIEADVAAGNKADACADLTAFINAVKAQSGKKLTAAEANGLIADARQIRNVLGC